VAAASRIYAGTHRPKTHSMASSDETDVYAVSPVETR
jgi:hypothetical protein